MSSSVENVGGEPANSSTDSNYDLVLRELVTINETPETEETKAEFAVTSVDLNIKSNVNAHRTNEFDITDSTVYDDTEQLVVRRGQPFDMKINFNRPFDKEKDNMKVIFEFGFNPLSTKLSRIELSFNSEDAKYNPWKASINSNVGNTLNITVTPSADCAVAKWSLKVDILVEKELERYTHKDPIYILFNPWCKDDLVYMESEELLQEYVMNESGFIFVGNYRQIRPRNWIFDQFTGKALECIMYLLDNKSRLWDNKRGDPVKVSRAISSFVNSSDNSGVLTGKWASDEDDYKPFNVPWSWTGSGDILDEYFKEKRPVRYGQCWVFSGVTTTVCRAIGIPARSVTNFSSAHDTDGSISIDEYFHKDGTEIKRLNADSVWNFHVWNDVWMKRPDLKSTGDYSYDGWQAIDATPQERSENVFRMGPMSLKAIKEGDLHCPYDGPFSFAEVNADKLVWRADQTGAMKLIRKDTNSVGKNISTKLPNSYEREDVTDQYKYGEDSTKEREALRKAHIESSSSKFYYEDKQDWKMKFSLDVKQINIGEPIEVNLKIKNDDEDGRMISGKITITCPDYTDLSERANTVVERHLSGGDRFSQLGEEKVVTVSVPFEDYNKELIDGNNVRVTCMCEVNATGQIFADTQIMTLEIPTLKVKTPNNAMVKKEFTIEATFENPLDIKLTGCEMNVNGPGLQISKTIPQSDVEAKSTFKFTYTFTPEKPGLKTVALAFNCKQLHSIQGVGYVQVAKQIEPTSVPMETE